MNTVTIQPTSSIESFFSIAASIFTPNKEVVSVIRMSGPIGKLGVNKGINIETYNSVIEEAFKPKKLAAVCVIINSPGGSPAQSDLIAKRLKQFSKKKNVPIYVFVEDCALSGGYWIACAAKEIYATRNSLIGSIGVISSSFGLNKVIQQYGIERRVYTEGKNKSFMDPFSEMKKDDVSRVKSLQKNIYESFVEHVKSSRGGKITQSDEILFEGGFWTANIALDYGLIDGLQDIYSFIEEKFGDKVKIKYPKVKKSWLKDRITMGDAILDIANNIEYKINHEDILYK